MNISSISASHQGHIDRRRSKDAANNVIAIDSRWKGRSFLQYGPALSLCEGVAGPGLISLVPGPGTIDHDVILGSIMASWQGSHGMGQGQFQFRIPFRSDCDPMASHSSHPITSHSIPNWRSTTLRNSSKMSDALHHWLQILFGSNDFDADWKCPSGSTLSRARPKVDVSLMLLRRAFWQENWQKMSIQLGPLTLTEPFLIDLDLDWLRLDLDLDLDLDLCCDLNVQYRIWSLTPLVLRRHRRIIKRMVVTTVESWKCKPRLRCNHDVQGADGDRGAFRLVACLAFPDEVTWWGSPMSSPMKFLDEVPWWGSLMRFPERGLNSGLKALRPGSFTSTNLAGGG